ncbi:MAG: putative oxidoreductase [Halocynthiibacter sp.]|jgi:uncharacterized oxidoreductase
MDFAGRTVLVTGATRGIGAAMVEQLIGAGANILAVARDPSALDRLAQKYPGAIQTCAVDLAGPQATKTVTDWVSQYHQDCSILINNAAIMEHVIYIDSSEDFSEEIDQEITINLNAPIKLSVAMLGILNASNGAAICNVTSGLAIAPLTNAAVYCATKAGLRSFTKALRYQCEIAQNGILVSEAIMTLVDTTLSHGEAKRKVSPQRAAKEVLAGLASNKKEIWVEKTKLLRIINRLSPALAAKILRG